MVSNGNHDDHNCINKLDAKTEQSEGSSDEDEA